MVLLPFTEVQRAFSFALVEWGGRAADDDGGPRVSSERLLEDTRELRVSVGDVRLVAVR